MALLAIGAALGLVESPARAQGVTLCYNRPITVLDLRNPTLVSGTALQVGAVYRFANAAPGIDVRIRIDALTNATLPTIDRDTGLIDNFQPELAGSGPRSADFTITYVIAGTTTPIAIDTVASGIDIDGDSVSLREYSEFSTPLASYVLNNPTNLDVNASTPSVASNLRFESRTAANAPDIDETAVQNIAAIVYTATSSFRYRVGVLGTGDTTRLTSLDFSCPNIPIPAQNTVVSQDYSDAPASFGNPVHDIAATIRLGATNTAEAARYNSADASADAGDDGVTFATLRRSLPATITVGVTGVGGRLQGWIDWNGDGDFADTGEQVATNVQDNGTGDANAATGTIALTVTPPALAILTPTFARFRWSTTAGLASSSVASNGEVEDYQVTVIGPAVLAVDKISVMYSSAGTDRFAIPGADILYSITTANTGTGPADTNSVVIFDALPSSVTFFNGDVDGAGPETGAIAFTQSGAGLTFTPATDLRYSNLAAAPASFAACTYTPVAGYDANVRHICLNPKGTMPSGTTSPSFTVQFRTRIN